MTELPSRIRFLIAVLILTALALPVFAENPIVLFNMKGDYIRHWVVCGPFPTVTTEGGNPEAIRQPGFYTDYLAPIGGEKNPSIVEGEPVANPAGAVIWRRVTAEDSTVDLVKAISKERDICAYACCIIECTQSEACVLGIGSNDGVRVWLNGEEVLDRPGARVLTPDVDLVPVVLKQGSNRLLLKVEQRGLSWGFCCRMLPFNHPRVMDRLGLFKVVTNTGGQPAVRFIHAPSLVGKAILKTTFEAFRTGDPSRVLWSSEWNGNREVPIEVPATDYGEYLLRVKTNLIGGAHQTMEIPFSAGKRIEYTLFRDGKTDYSIVLAEDASASEKWAAQELQHWLKEVSGVEFPVSRGTVEEGKPAIFVGLGKKALSLLGAGAVVPSVTDESFTYLNRGPSILIWGGKQRGTQYGVLSFLERELGIRWYTPSVSVAPSRFTYSFFQLNHTEAPGIRVRNDFYFEAFDPTWAARNRINGAMATREQPGGVEAYWSVHTFFPLMPPEEFFDDHPEYYSLIDGVRTHDHAQLCTTNPDVVRILTERILKVMHEQPDYLIYDVSQNDWHGACQCDKCQAIATAEESESGPVIHLVNQIAESVEKEFPDKFIGTLAYQYTRKPCKTLRPRHNVVVRLCSIECCFSHDFQSCKENQSFVEDLTRWAEIAPHLYIWDYVVNFSHYIMPYPNFRVLQPNLQLLRRNKAIGVMEQAAYQSRGGEFAELRAYVLARLLWNPDADVESAINDFLFGYYGRAGQFVREYFDLLHGRVNEDTHIHLGLKPEDPLFSEEFVRQSMDLFQKAKIVADNEEIRKRVELTSLPILYLKCKRTPEIALADGTYASFCEIAEREGVTHYAESGEPHREAFHREMKGE